MNGRRRWLLVVGAILATSGAAAWVYRNRTAPKVEVQAEEPQAPEVTELIISGQLRAKHIVPVAAPLDGVLEEVDVIDGQEIFEGQLLGRVQNTALDAEAEQAKAELERLQTRVTNLQSQLISNRLESSRAEADAARARAEFAAAEKDYRRQQMLLAEGATPRLTFEKAEKDYQRLKGESDALSEMARQSSTKIEAATLALDETRKVLADKSADLDEVEQELLSAEIRAPVDGVLLAHRGSSGDEVKRNMRDLFQIGVNLAELELVAKVTPDQATKIQLGQPVAVQVVEAGGGPLLGMVRTIENHEAIIDVSVTEAAVKPGLTAQVRIPLAESSSP